MPESSGYHLVKLELLSNATTIDSAYNISEARKTTTGERESSKLAEEEISEVAIIIAKRVIDIGLLLRGEFTLQSFLNILENWSRISSFAYEDVVANKVHNFIIQHYMGSKYLFFVKEIFQYILQEIFKIKLDFTITDNTVMF
jgi:hypothetical protein